MNFRITFHLDGTGVYYDPNEPTMLDGLLAWVLGPRQGIRGLDRSGIPQDVQLPLMRETSGDTWIWRASALFPTGPQSEGLWHWRKRLRQSRIDVTTGSPNLQNGQYRDWQTPLPLLLCTQMVAYANGNGKEMRRILREVRYVGKKSAHGHGKVLSVDVDQIEQDHSLVMDGHAMRWLPSSEGTRLVRPRPPYWHPHGRIASCEIGSPRPNVRVQREPTA